jgi:hypothetical protein
MELLDAAIALLLARVDYAVACLVADLELTAPGDTIAEATGQKAAVAPRWTWDETFAAEYPCGGWRRR